MVSVFGVPWKRTLKWRFGWRLLIWRGDPRKNGDGVGETETGKKNPKYIQCIYEQVTAVGTGLSSSWGWLRNFAEHTSELQNCPAEKRKLGYLSTNSCPSLVECGCRGVNSLAPRGSPAQRCPLTQRTPSGREAEPIITKGIVCSWVLAWAVSALVIVFFPRSINKYSFLRLVQFKNMGTSLVAQWLRICLPTQGTQVRALVREDPTCHGATKPVHHNYWACALELARHNYWAHVPQLLKPVRLEPMLRNKRSHCNEKTMHRSKE